MYRCPSECRRKCHLPLKPRNRDISQSKGFCHLKKTKKKKKKIQQEETNAINKTSTCTHGTHAPHRVESITNKSPFRHRCQTKPHVHERPPPRLPAPPPPLGAQTRRRVGAPSCRGTPTGALIHCVTRGKCQAGRKGRQQGQETERAEAAQGGAAPSLSLYNTRGLDSSRNCLRGRKAHFAQSCLL